MNLKVRKTDLFKKHIASGDYKEALRIAKDFRIGITGRQKHLLTLAYECLAHPEFYFQIGRDVNADIQAGIDIALSIYPVE